MVKEVKPGGSSHLLRTLPGLSSPFCLARQRVSSRNLTVGYFLCPRRRGNSEDGLQRPALLRSGERPGLCNRRASRAGKGYPEEFSSNGLTVLCTQCGAEDLPPLEEGWLEEMARAPRAIYKPKTGFEASETFRLKEFGDKLPITIHLRSYLCAIKVGTSLHRSAKEDRTGNGFCGRNGGGEALVPSSFCKSCEGKPLHWLRKIMVPSGNYDRLDCSGCP